MVGEGLASNKSTSAEEKENVIKAWCVEEGGCKKGGQEGGVLVPRSVQDKEGNRIGDWVTVIKSAIRTGNVTDGRGAREWWSALHRYVTFARCEEKPGPKECTKHEKEKRD